MKYRKKPVVIEAIQYDGDNGWLIQQWSGDSAIESPVLEPSKINPSGKYMQIKTLEGVHCANPGDYIIRGVRGELCPCKPDIFAETYEEVRDIG